MEDGSGHRFPVVGIGGSAGGLEAFFSVFAALERLDQSPGMAFIMVLHLPTDQESHLADLLRLRTRLPVEVVEASSEIQLDRVYILPPGKTFDVQDGTLVTRERLPGAAHHPVDDLFVAMARGYGARSVAVVCSGTGSDGSAGLGPVREAGGCTIAQEPETAGFDQMPRRAIATGQIDLVLSPDQMIEALLRNGQRLASGPLDPGPDVDDEAPSAQPAVTQEEGGSDDPFSRILKVLRSRSSLDFRHYKTGTLKRRIDRRVLFLGLENQARYADLLAETPQEIDALLNDFLISVTAFFRDESAWQGLTRSVLEPLVRDNAEGKPLRIWSAGCATGEEAYSVAMALFEAASAQRKEIAAEVFATDASQSALARARQGRYPAGAVRDLPEERIERWFTRDDGYVQVKPALRETMIFAAQDLIQDPPFSRADLVLCRNVLIYLKPEVQQKLIRLFHFALKEGGVLFLGNSEDIGAATDLFEPIDRAARIYRRLGATRHDVVTFPIMRSRSRPAAEGAPQLSGPPPVADLALKALASQYAPPSVLVDQTGTILYYHGATHRFLKPPSGEATHSLMALAPDALVPHLVRVTEAAMRSGSLASSQLIWPPGAHSTELRIEASRVSSVSEDPVLLVSFLQGSAAPRVDGTGDDAAASLREGELEDEVRVLRASAFSSSRDHEELTAANEEITSMNEELRAANEEMETSKEELQSLNEELSTINSQLHSKVVELNERTADLNNLLVSTSIATLFLKADFTIRWFSPNLDELFHIRQADIDRPISHVVRTHVDETLEADCRRVLRTLIPAEAQVAHQDGRIFTRRISPYRTLDDRIAGVVINFTDVTAIQDARRYAERIVETIPTSFLVLETDHRVRSANPAFYEAFRVRPEETEGHLIYDLGNRQWDIPELRHLLTVILPDNDIFDHYEVEHEFEGIGRKTLLLNGRRLDHVQLILLAIEDITARKSAERHQAMLTAELGHRVKNALGVVQGLASQTLKRSGSLEEFRQAFSGRLAAFARSHSQLLTRDWEPGTLKDLVQDAIEAHAADPERIRVKGPKIAVSQKQALALGLFLHELETNAVKYGALSNEAGHVEIRWARDGTDVTLNWREKGGPPVAPPQREGFGSTLIRQLAAYDLEGTCEITYAATGLVCWLRFPEFHDGKAASADQA